MFISWQTFEGLKVTVHSIIEAVKFLLQHHVKYVLTVAMSTSVPILSTDFLHVIAARPRRFSDLPF